MPDSLQTIRFGEFLLEREVITEEELLASLGEHWSNGGRLGAALAKLGILASAEIELQASAYHDLSVVEIGA